MDTLLGGVVGQVPAYLKLCMVDADPVAPRRRLSGRPGCETERDRLLHERPIVFAGRQLEVRVSAAPGDGSRQRRPQRLHDRRRRPAVGGDARRARS